MARLARLVLAGCAHLVLHRAHSGQSVFADAVDADVYVGLLHRFAREQHVRIHAYAVLDNEVRLLLTPSTSEGLGRLMKLVASGYSAHHNRDRTRSGSPWEGRFRSAPVEEGAWTVWALWHVEAHSPVGTARARVRLSSVAHHSGERADTLVNESPEYWAFGNTPFERQAAYRAWTHTYFVDESAAVASVMRGWPVGSAAFLLRTAQRLGRATVPAKRGRPPRPSVPS